MLSNGMMQGCILWEFYKDPKKISMRIDFFRSNKSHLPFKDPGSIRMPIGPLHMDLYWEDRCKDSKGIDRSFKDFYKDSSWNSIGFP